MRNEAREDNQAIKETISVVFNNLDRDRISSWINSEFLKFNGDPI